MFLGFDLGRLSGPYQESSKVKPVAFAHHIVTEGPPTFCIPRRLSPANLKAAKASFYELLDLDIIQRSDSPWQSPLVLVSKPDGSSRACGDYTALNQQTPPGQVSPAHLHDFSANLAGCKVFSKVDLKKGFHQIPMNPADIPKTAISTPFGAFEHKFMPYGLRNAPQTFQRAMDSALQGLDFMFAYMDDILVASKNHHEHKNHLKVLFQRLQDRGYLLNANKCEFGHPSLVFSRPQNLSRRHFSTRIRS